MVLHQVVGSPCAIPRPTALQTPTPVAGPQGRRVEERPRKGLNSSSTVGELLAQITEQLLGGECIHASNLSRGSLLTTHWLGERHRTMYPTASLWKMLLWPSPVKSKARRSPSGTTSHRTHAQSTSCAAEGCQKSIRR